jgi:hypothetical protein
MIDSTSQWMANLGFWVGLLVTLLLFSAAFGDHVLARLGQHLLVGAALGYAGVVAVQQVLRPRLLTPVFDNPNPAWEQWAPLVLGVVLVVAGLDRTWRPAAAGIGLPLWRRALHGLGRIPVAFLVGVGLAAGLFGAFQGTFLPQFLRAARIAFNPAAEGPLYLVGLLTLLLTTAALLYFLVDRSRPGAVQSGMLRSVLHGWIWVGQRAVWVAAGILFARLFASRLSLLIGRVEYLHGALGSPTFWRWWDSLWGGLGG